MKKINTCLAFLMTLAIHANGSAADTRATVAEVMVKVDQAVALLEELGEAALNTIADPASGFVWQDSYVFVVNCDADRVLVNPAFPERIGGDIKQHGDYAGNPYGERLCRTAAEPDGGWLEYVWQRPGDALARRKVSYVRSVPGLPLQVGAGVYDEEIPLAELPGGSRLRDD